MTPAAAPLPPEVADALQRGQKIEAIQLLREKAGINLAEARTAVEAWQRGDPAPVRAPASIGGLPASVLEALQRGDKVDAIRRMRAETGMDLKASKDAVDAWEGHAAPAAVVQRAPGEVAAGSSIVKWVVAGVLLVLLLGWYFLRTSV